MNTAIENALLRLIEKGYAVQRDYSVKKGDGLIAYRVAMHDKVVGTQLFGSNESAKLLPSSEAEVEKLLKQA